MSELLKLYTLGKFSIYRGEIPIGGFVSRKVEGLLAYLAYTGQEQPREVLAELLWDNRAQERAASNLRTIISSLQQQLAPYLNITRYSVGLNADYWLDAAELENGLKIAQHRWAQYNNLSNTIATQLEQTLALYQGDFLAGFHIRDANGFDAWQTQVQESLRIQTLTALKRLAEHAMEQRLWEDGIKRSQQMLTIDPLQEESHALLMRFLAQAGQRQAALNQYQTCVKLLRKELNTVPDQSLTDLHREIQAGTFTIAAPGAPPVARLIPTPPTSFVARPAELSQIVETLTECRVITLVGHGGIGKTRLAIESAAHLTGFSDGIFFISLSTLANDSFMVSLIADTLGAVMKSRDELQKQLLDHLRDKTLLLILDNFEHLIPNGIPLVVQILESAPSVKLLITSRERLNIRGEVPLSIDGMAYPHNGESLSPQNGESYPSVQLLVQSLRNAQPNFTPQAGEWEHIARICRLVNGIPLGLELASSWIHTLSLREIADEIENNLDFLESSFQDTPERHRSIRAVFEYTWNRLSEAEQRTFSRLSVFRGGFTREAASEIASASTITLHGLIGKSLLKRDSAGRYSVHELLRQYAAQKLIDSQQIIARHCAYYASLLHSLDRGQWNKIDQLMIEQVALDIENFRLAWDYALQVADQPTLVQCVRILFAFYEFQGRYREGSDLFQDAVTRLQGTKREIALAMAYLSLFRGIFYKNMAQYGEAEALLHQCLPVLQEQATPTDVLLAMNTLGGIAYARGDYVASTDWYEHILAANRQHNNLPGVANTLMRLGDIAVVLGQYERAYHLMSESLALFHHEESQWGIASVLATLGDVTCKLGQFDRALEYFEESLIRCRAMGERRGEGVALINLGRVLRIIGRNEDATRFCKESLAIFTESGNRWGQAFAHLHLGMTYFDKGKLSAAQEQYMAALTLARTVGIKWISAYTLRQICVWYLTQGFYQQAKDSIIESLAIAQQVNATPLLLHGLVSAAPLHPEEVQLELLSFVLEHPASEYETRTEAKTLLNMVDPNMPGYAEAYSRGCQRELSEILLIAQS